MPSLITGPTPVKIQYAVSLPHSLLSTIGLMCAFPEFEGLGDWLREVRASLPAELRQELCVLMTFAGRYQRLAEELLATLSAECRDWAYDRFLAHLQELPAEEYQRMALVALTKGSETPPPLPELLALLSRPDECAAYLAEIDSSVPPEVVRDIACDGGRLKARLVSSVDRFWHSAYAAEFEATRPLMERSVSYHRAQRYGPDLNDVFVTVTGRLVPETLARLLPSVSEVTFIPSTNIGPYVAFMRHGSSLVLYYNCRSAAVEQAALPAAGHAALYPPLKALADETRLQILALLHGRELYAQEIVERLNISQPAVSRHLNLMVAAGVLSIRREGNAKYYAVNGPVLAELAAALAAFS